jgi:hypothetical protein
MHHVSHLLNGDTGAVQEWPLAVVGLDALLEAQTDARTHRRDPWQFAVEMERLLAFGLTVGQLRRWVSQGWLLHGVETTQRTSNERTFDLVHHLGFEPGTCFVLSEDGVTKATAKVVQVKRGPRWDGRRLYWGMTIVKHFRQTAPCQRIILDAFEEQDWASEIDDPLPGTPTQDRKIRLRFTIRTLNRNMQKPLIHFGGNGTGDGVCWFYNGVAAAEAPPILVTDP